MVGFLSQPEKTLNAYYRCVNVNHMGAKRKEKAFSFNKRPCLQAVCDKKGGPVVCGIKPIVSGRGAGRDGCIADVPAEPGLGRPHVMMAPAGSQTG